MLVLAVMIAAVFLVTFLAAPTLGGGWFWDIGAGLGYLAFAGLLFQMIPWREKNGWRAHEWLGYGVLGAALGHVFWLLAGDGTARVYLQPGAPLYMWLGLFALLALAALTILARMPDRVRRHRGYRAFRRTHRLLGLGVAFGAAAHVALSGFYLPAAAQVAVFATLTLGVCLGRRHWARFGPARAAPVPAFLLIGAAAVALFAAARNLFA